VRDYRFAFVIRGSGLGAAVSDTDPQEEGARPRPAAAQAPGSERTAKLVNDWIDQAMSSLGDQPVANGLTLRGFSTDPELARFSDLYALTAACVAVYPMYRGVSRLVGMDVIEFAGERPEDEFAAVRDNWASYEFFFIHIKATDSRGEDGDFDGKAAVIESVDRALPGLLELRPDVLAVTGDHSTPARLRTHSWHPVPFLLWAPETIRQDGSQAFGESACMHGGLGTFQATSVMPLLLAHAQRLNKFGA
jgi:2,3-bisphosphoglycerate-independent phosphoglycerate mutase